MPPKHLTVWLYYTAVAFYATESLIRLMGIEWSTPLSEPESRPPKLLLLLSLLLDKLDKKKHGDADFAQPFATLLIRKILGVRKYIFKKQTAATAVCDRKTYWWCKLWQNNANRGFWPQQKKGTIRDPGWQDYQSALLLLCWVCVPFSPAGDQYSTLCIYYWLQTIVLT